MVRLFDYENCITIKDISKVGSKTIVGIPLYTAPELFEGHEYSI